MPGAAPGRKGSGCFKLSAEEKARRDDAVKSASRKLKGAGKVNQKRYHTVCGDSKLRSQVTSKAPKKVAKKAGGSSKKVPAKKAAVSSKKPAPKAKKTAKK